MIGRVVCQATFVLLAFPASGRTGLDAEERLPTDDTPSSCSSLASAHACTKLNVRFLDTTIDAGLNFWIVARGEHLDLVTMEVGGYFVRRLGADGLLGNAVVLNGPPAGSTENCQFAARGEDLGAHCEDHAKDEPPKVNVYAWGPDNSLAWTAGADDASLDNYGIAGFGSRWIVAWAHYKDARPMTATFDARGDRISGPEYFLPPPAITSDPGLSFATTACNIVIAGARFGDAQQHQSTTIEFGFPDDPGKRYNPSTTFGVAPVEWPYEANSVALLWTEDFLYVPHHITVMDRNGAERSLPFSAPPVSLHEPGVSMAAATSWGLFAAMTEIEYGVPYPPGHTKVTLFVLGPDGNLTASTTFDSDGGTTGVIGASTSGRVLIGWETLAGNRFGVVECEDNDR